ncbi:MAG: class I SAM-dependent methyltransferase [Bacteroidales bacterium]|nr:class I SAM-dependent methyltransferase [Bacteroidales bacterium]
MISEKLNILSDSFMDVTINKTIANIIATHISNKQDIREITLKEVSLHSAKNILDLGCGFGFFIKSLKNKVHPQAQILGIDRCIENKHFFLDSCAVARLKGEFINSDMSILNKIESNSYDFILCSYALYFFPEAIPQISRILKNDGIFIAVTHAKNHLHELISYIKNIQKKNNSKSELNIPYEKLISNFSDENGNRLLSPYFDNIKKIDYKSFLVFSENEVSDLITYLKLKYSFYIGDDEKLINDIINQLKKDIVTMKGFKFAKDDVIFICSQAGNPKPDKLEKTNPKYTNS